MVQFVKQSDISKYPKRCFSAALSSAYKDVFDNSQTTVNISNVPSDTGMFLEIPTSETPPYGSGNVIGYKLGLYLNSITTDQASNPSLTVWKAKRGITGGEGNFGTTIKKGTDIYSMTSFAEYSADGYFSEDFTSTTSGTTSVLDTGVRTVALGQWYSKPNILWNSRNLVMNPTNATTLSYEEWKKAWSTTIQTGADATKTMDVIYITLKTKNIPGVNISGLWKSDETVMTERKYWVMDNPKGSDHDGDTGYMEFDEGILANAGEGSNPHSGEEGDEGASSNIDRWNSYQLSYALTASAESPIKKSNTNLANIMSSPQGTSMRLSDTSDGSKNIFKNGIYKDTDALSGGAAIRFHSMISNGITTSDKGMKELFLQVDPGEVESNGFLMANCIKQTSFPTPIQLTKLKDNDSGQEMTSTSDVAGTDLVFTLKLDSIPEICCASSSVAYFPSRCVAVWFKNRLDDATEEDYDNVAQDMYANLYSNTDADYINQIEKTATEDNIFCGFFLYKFNGSLYFKSIGKPDDGDTPQFGTNFEGTTKGAIGADYVPYNFKGHPTEDFDGEAVGTIKLGKLMNKWMDVVCRWKSGSGNGFELIFRDTQTKAALHDQIHVSTTAGGTPNDDYAFPYYSFATYNCAALGTGTGINHRPEFAGLGAATAEAGNQIQSNTLQELVVVLDKIAMSNYGLNYTHLNSTITDERPAQKITISVHDGPDFSVDMTKGSKMTLASERTAEDAPALPSILSFGFKNAGDVKSGSGYPKHLFFSGFTCGNIAGNSAIPPSYMKWAWSTDAARLGKQLWSSNSADDAAVHVGTLSEANNQFIQSGGSQNMVFTTAAATSLSKVSILNNEGFQQKGHLLWSESTFANHSKRENIFTSARIVGTNSRSSKVDTLITKDERHIFIDDVNILTKWKNGSDDSGETYSIFIYNKPNYKCWKKTGLTVNHVDTTSIEGLSGYTKIGFNNNPKFSDAYDEITGASKVVTSDSQVFNDSPRTITFTNPKIADTGSVIDLREYFKGGDKITIGYATGINNGTQTVASVTATVVTVIGTLVDETDSNATMKHLTGSEDLLVSTIGDVRYDDLYTAFLSPERYWIFGEIHNQDTSDLKLPTKSYDSVVLTDFDMDGTGGFSDFGTDDFGATFSEYKITDSTINTNEWSLDRASTVGGVLDTSTDYGFGAYDPDTGEGGFLQRFIPQLNFAEAAQYNIVDLSHMPVVDAGNSIYLWLHPQNTHSQTRTNISTFKDVATKRPFLLTTFEDEIPAHPSLTVEPYKENGFLPHYKWDASEDDLWYGLLFIDNSQIMNQYHNLLYRIPLNEDLTGYATSSYAGLIYLEDGDGNFVNGTMPDGIVEDRYDGLAGHSKRFSNSSNSMLRFPATNTGVGLGDKFSFICHITPDSGTLTEATYIAYQRSDTNNDIDYSWQIILTQTGLIELSVQGKKADNNLTNLVTVLTSASTIQRDSESPTMVCWTLDNELEAGNIKLFINGILEASTGLLRTSSVSNSSNQWAKNLVIDPDVEEMCIGGDYQRSGTDYDCFSGKIEEIAAYSTVIYPVNPRKGEFVWRKPVKDFVGSRGTPLSYVARLFVKDFHNIRGRSTSDVAVSPPVSFIKPILGNRGD
tara:strand:- start:4562 stop:9403 length:4842 start_codon:yes stop_codon:yes gene_type:complete